MAYDPKRPRPSLPSEDEPAPVDGLIELTDPPQPVGEPTTGSPDPAAESGPRSALGSAPVDDAERSRDDMAPGTAGPGEAAAAVGSGIPPALVAAAVAAVAALVAIILLRRRRARG